MSNSLWPHELQHARLPSFTISWSLLKLISIESVMSSNHLIPCHLLLPAPTPAFNLCQHQDLFQWVSSSQQVAKSLRASASIRPKNIQDWLSLGLTGLISLLSKGLSRVFSNATIKKHQFFSIQPSLWSNSHIHTWLLGKNIALTI